MKNNKIVLWVLLIAVLLILFVEVSPFNTDYIVPPNTNVNVPVQVLLNAASGGQIFKPLPKSITENSGTAGGTVTDTITSYENGVLNYTSPSGRKNVTQYTSTPVGDNDMYRFHSNVDKTGITDCITQYDADVRRITNGTFNQNIVNLANSVCVDSGYTLLDPKVGNISSCTSTSVPDGYNKNGVQYSCKTFFDITIKLPPLNTSLINGGIFYTRYNKDGKAIDPNVTPINVSSNSVMTTVVKMNIGGYGTITIPIITSSTVTNFIFYFGNSCKNSIFTTNKLQATLGNNPYFLSNSTVQDYLFSNTVQDKSETSTTIGNIIKPDYIVIHFRAKLIGGFTITPGILYPQYTQDYLTGTISSVRNYNVVSFWTFNIDKKNVLSTININIGSIYDNKYDTDISIPLGGFIFFQKTLSVITNYYNKKFYYDKKYMAYTFLNPATSGDIVINSTENKAIVDYMPGFSTLTGEIIQSRSLDILAKINNYLISGTLIDINVFFN